MMANVVMGTIPCTLCRSLEGDFLGNKLSQHAHTLVPSTMCTHFLGQSEIIALLVLKWFFGEGFPPNNWRGFYMYFNSDLGTL